MTRKRFVKLLMARGMSRNDANEVALAIQVLGIGYCLRWLGNYQATYDTIMWCKNQREKYSKMNISELEELDAPDYY